MFSHRPTRKSRKLRTIRPTPAPFASASIQPASDPTTMLPSKTLIGCCMYLRTHFGVIVKDPLPWTRLVHIERGAARVARTPQPTYICPGVL